MNMIIDFAFDYIGFCLMISGFLIGGRTVTDWIQSIRIKDIKTYKDLYHEDLMNLAVAITAIVIGRILTLY